MKKKTQSLTVYAIRDRIAGMPIEELSDVIAKRDDYRYMLATGRMQEFDLIDEFDYEAKLFIAKPKRTRPPWIDFLEAAFGDFSDALEETVTNGAVVVLKVALGGRDRCFALTFGAGRYLLRSGSVRPGSGRRVALNAIYPRDRRGADAARIRSLKFTTRKEKVFYTSRLCRENAAFEEFGVDNQRDQLNGLTGRPADRDRWGSRLSGSDNLRLSLLLTVDDLGELCRRIWSASERDDFKDDFDWVESVTWIDAPGAIETMEKQVVDALESAELHGLMLATPQYIDFDQVDGFRYSVEPDVVHDELDLGQYLELRAAAGDTRSNGSPEPLSAEALRTETVEAVEDGEIVYRWPVWECVSGEVASDGKTTLLEGGKFFEVEPNFERRLDLDLDAIAESDQELPPAKLKEREDAYNARVAKDSEHYLNLDKELVRVSNRTSPVEICDLLTDEGSFIHVKKRAGSSAISHLCAQGLVSADLLLTNREYLEVVRQEVHNQVLKQGKSEVFEGLLEHPSPRDCTVVYGIISDWKTPPDEPHRLARELPFFSKVNLRRYAAELRRMGYRVAYRPIPWQAAEGAPS